MGIAGINSRFTLMTQKQMNIFRVYSQATADEIDNGLRWYTMCRDDAYRMIPDDVNKAAAIIAVLSPGMKFEYNLLAAEALIAGESLDGFGVRWYANVKKARRILAGESADRVLSGLKVRAFYACIINPLSNVVCVDSHAYGIWVGRYVIGEDVPDLRFHNRYSKISADYQAVAKYIGIAAGQLQAICWVCWRRLNEVKGESVPFSDRSV